MNSVGGRGDKARKLLGRGGWLLVLVGFVAAWNTNSLRAFLPVPLGFASVALAAVLAPMPKLERADLTAVERWVVIIVTKTVTALGIVVIGTFIAFVLADVANLLTSPHPE
ncbi:hypothetical protein GPX89_31840 [Nocardia sp. ET3-3]|uniref:Uncharacterized protein n=1 Tax=Nocardia terrae TaxID=2675851 RepID=A0A7K1V5E7_9NOCA|nr:hypothetical protein [Nocardia terrae]MVU81816.1 hypothetical protein [Nocardia terrae]